MDDIPGIPAGFPREPEEQDRMARCVKALGNADTSLTDGVLGNQLMVFPISYTKAPL